MGVRIYSLDGTWRTAGQSARQVLLSRVRDQEPVIGFPGDAHSLRRMHVKSAVLDGSSFVSADLGGSMFERCDLRGVNFSHADLLDVCFDGSHLDRVDFVSNHYWSNGRIADCNLSVVHFQQTMLDNLACFDTRIDHGLFAFCNLHDGHWSNGQIDRTVFSCCRFSNTGMYNVVFSDVAFTNCDLSGVKFYGPRFRRVAFRACTLPVNAHIYPGASGTSFAGCIFPDECESTTDVDVEQAMPACELKRRNVIL